MEVKKDEYELYLSSDWRSIVAWYCLLAVLLVAFYYTFVVILNAPTLPLVVVSLLFLGAAISGVFSARAFVEISETGIRQRFIRTRSWSWDDLRFWTQWGEGRSIYVETKAGEVFGFSHWCVFGDRLVLVANILSKRIGAESKGANAVFPSILNLIIGKLRLPPPDEGR